MFLTGLLLALIFFGLCFGAIRLINWLHQRSLNGPLTEPSNAAERKERVEKLKEAGFESLDDFVQFCQKLRLLRCKYIPCLLEENKRFPSLPAESTASAVLARLLLVGHPEKIIQDVWPLQVEDEMTSSYRLYLIIDKKDVEPYRRLEQISFSRLVETDQQNLLKSLFNTALPTIMSLRIYLS